MFLNQLKQLTLSATRRNAQILRLPRLYSSPPAPAAVSETLTTTTSKPSSKRLSRDDRRLLVESFVSKYRAANAGKFPSYKTTVKEVGGGYHIVRNILQELKLRPNAPIISRVPASIAAIDASSHKQEEDRTVESSQHPSSDEVCLQGDKSLVITATHDRSETVTASLDSICDDGSSTHIPEVQTLKVSGGCSETEEEGTLAQIAATQEPRADHLQGANRDVDSKCDGSSTRLPEIQTLKVSEECSETEEEGTLTQIAATQEPRADHLQGANKDVGSKCDGSSTHLPETQTLKVSGECLKKPEIEEDETLTQIASQKPEAEDHIEGGAASANVLPTETRQVPEKGDAEVKTGESSGAWSNIISFAKGFASFWRKG